MQLDLVFGFYGNNAHLIWTKVSSLIINWRNYDSLCEDTTACYQNDSNMEISSFQTVIELNGAKVDEAVNMDLRSVYICKLNQGFQGRFVRKGDSYRHIEKTDAYFS